MATPTVYIGAAIPDPKLCSTMQTPGASISIYPLPPRIIGNVAELGRLESSTKAGCLERSLVARGNSWGSWSRPRGYYWEGVAAASIKRNHVALMELPWNIIIVSVLLL